MNDVVLNESPRPKHTRFIWMLLATFALLASAGALTLWLPYHQRNAVIAEIESRGGLVRLRPNAPLWLEQYIDPNRLRVFDQVVMIDLMEADFSDDDMDMLVELPETQGIVIFAPALTDAGVARLKEMTSLVSLMMVNCPKVSAKALQDLKAERPQLQILRRGEAFLGIAGVTTPQGCMVQQVVPGSTADRAGLRSGDVISAFDGVTISTYDELTNLLNEKQPGQIARMRLTHAGESQPLEVEATLGNWETRKLR